MRKATSRWLVVAMALACATPCMADEEEASASATSSDVIKVPVWRKGKVQQPSARAAGTSSAKAKISKAQYAPSASDEPQPAPQPEADGSSMPSSSTLAPSCNLPASTCDTPCTPSCGSGNSCSLGCGKGYFGCNTGCQNCGDNCCCCGNLWQHRSGVFAEYLYLRPTGADMAYAIQQNGVGGPGTVPNGSVGVLHPDYSSGFRVGGNYALDCYSSIVASFSSFDSPSASTLTAQPGVGSTVESLTLHPGSVNAGSTATSIASTYGINFKMASIDYRHLLIGSQCFAVNYSVGVAYGHLGQNFQATGSFTPPAGTIQNTTAIHYDGGGLRYGLDFQRALGRRGLSIYGKSFVDILFGQFEATYDQVNTTTTATQAQSNWRNDRVLPILETELGLAWTSAGGHFRVSGGYYNSFWFNAITTPQYVQAVQTANYTNLSQTIAFDGLVGRVEFRF